MILHFIISLLSLTVCFILILTAYLRLSLRMCKSDVSMKDKVVIVTGANSGLGFHTAKSLAKRGARVILACRSEKRANAAIQEIIKSTGNRDVVFRLLDLASLDSVRKFAANILASESRLDVLINNAGVFGCSEYTDDGIITSMQINYFGHFLLTLLLLPLLKKSKPSRIINLSSIYHFNGRFDRKTINERKSIWESVQNYSNSKFCMLMFAIELSRRLEGTGVVANAVHPGYVRTDITSHSSTIFEHYFFKFVCMLYDRSPYVGAQTIEYVAVSEECAQQSGKYFVDCASRYVLPAVKDKQTAKDLWEYSEALVKYHEGQ